MCTALFPPRLNSITPELPNNSFVLSLSLSRNHPVASGHLLLMALIFALASTFFHILNSSSLDWGSSRKEGSL